MGESSRKRDVDLTNGSIIRQLISYSLPVAIGVLFQQLYNTVDTIVVGQFVSTEALAAVGSTGPLINMLVGFANGFAIGSSVVISQAYGAKDQKMLHTAVHTTMAMTFILGVLMTLLGLVFTGPLLRLMKIPETVMPEASAYLTIYFAGVSGLLIYNMGSAVLRAVGDSKRPLYFLIVSAFLNVAGDLLFVIVFRLGVAGVAYATVLAQLVSAVLVMIVLTREKGSYGVHWKEIRLEKDMVGRISKIGLPLSFEAAVTAFSNVFVQSYINDFGSTVMAGYTAYTKLDAFVCVPFSAISSFNATFVGQNYGAGKNKRAREGVRISLLTGIGLTVVLVGALLLLRRQAIQLFTNEADVREMGAYFIQICAPFYVCCGIFDCFNGALRGTGDSKTPMFAMLGSFVAFRQIYLAIVRACGNSMSLIILGYPIGWAMCAIVSGILYRRCRLFRPDQSNTPLQQKDA